MFSISSQFSCKFLGVPFNGAFFFLLMFGKFALNFTLNTKPYARLLLPRGNSSKKFFFSKARYCGAGTFICLPQVVSLLMQHADQLTKNFPQGLTLSLEVQCLFCCECALHLPPGILYIHHLEDFIPGFLHRWAQVR